MPSDRRAKRWVVAIGGNALDDARDPQGLGHQGERARDLAPALVDVLAAGTRLIIVHGNGPQVGARLIQNEAAQGEVPPAPLHVCVAETQGQIGHELTLALQDELRKRGLELQVAALLTHVLVDPGAAEFSHPDKPVGPAYIEDDAQRLMRDRRWRMARLPQGTWRRVVPSPRPLSVLEEEAVLMLIDGGCCVIAGGGGGVPLAERPGGGLVAVDAVIDKDYVAERLATAMGASRLIMLTDVPGAALSFAGAQPRFLDALSAKEARRYLDEGEFAAGSMGPKMEACVLFLEHGGHEAVIAAREDAGAAFAGRGGTRIT